MVRAKKYSSATVIIKGVKYRVCYRGRSEYSCTPARLSLMPDADDGLRAAAERVNGILAEVAATNPDPENQELRITVSPDDSGANAATLEWVRTDIQIILDPEVGDDIR